MTRDIRRVCVYCGSSDEVAGDYLQAAWEMGTTIARRALTLVFGGGGTGLMGALADAALEGEAHVIGVIPQGFNTPQLVHPGVEDLRVVDGMHNRKASMADLADSFVALPGGFGTLEELFEILTWSQIGLHQKPVGVLNVQGFFDPLLDLIEHIRTQGFIYHEHRSLLLSDRHPDSLLDQMIRYRPPEGLARWVERPEEER